MNPDITRAVTELRSIAYCLKLAESHPLTPRNLHDINTLQIAWGQWEYRLKAAILEEAGLQAAGHAHECSLDAPRPSLIQSPTR